MRQQSTVQVMDWLAARGELLISSTLDDDGRTWWTVEYKNITYEGTYAIQVEGRALGLAVREIYKQADAND